MTVPSKPVSRILSKDNHLSWPPVARRLFAPNLELSEQRHRSGSGLLRVEFGLFTPSAGTAVARGTGRD